MLSHTTLSMLILCPLLRSDRVALSSRNLFISSPMKQVPYAQDLELDITNDPAADSQSSMHLKYSTMSPVQTEYANADTPNAQFSCAAVRTEFPSLRLHICVLDSGVGIAPKDMAKLFVPFTQLSTGEKDPGVCSRPLVVSRFLTFCADRGSGLGLSITKKLIELHGSGWHYSICRLSELFSAGASWGCKAKSTRVAGFSSLYLYPLNGTDCGNGIRLYQNRLQRVYLF